MSSPSSRSCGSEASTAKKKGARVGFAALMPEYTSTLDHRQGVEICAA